MRSLRNAKMGLETLLSILRLSVNSTYFSESLPILKILVVAAAKALKGLSLEGKSIEIKNIMSGDFNNKTSIFIKSLNEKTTEEDLIEEFSKFGLIISCMVHFQRR
jgi:hypothetical protein